MTSSLSLPTSENNRPMAFLCLLGSMLCFGSVLLFIKHFSHLLDAWVVNGIRYSIAALIWFPVAILILKRQPKLSGVWRAAIVPSLVNFCGQVGWATTPYYSDASVIGFGIESTFLFAVLFGLTFLPQERQLGKLPLFWIGVAGCIIGVVVMYWAALHGSGKTSPKGIALIIGTSVFWGMYPVSVKRFMKNFPVRLSFGIISLYTATGLLILMFVRGNFSPLATLGTKNWLLLVLSAVIGIASSHVLLYRAIAVFGPLVTSGTGLATPFITWMGAAILFGERMSVLRRPAAAVIRDS